jgi:DNA invertase Pin-like site-specific DNA recombinase
MSAPLRAVIYARCSSLKQADRDLSVPAQLDACRQHAARQGWLIVGEYHDDGISGFEDERRPAFRRMLADMVASPRPFDVIVVWDFSRFSRSLEHSLKAMQDLRAAGVSLESTKEQTDDTPAGWLMGTIFRSFNEYQVRKLADDTRRGMRKNATEGGWNGGSLPMGYRVQRAEGGRGPGRLVVDPQWAPLVQRIFAMALAGTGSCAIAATLNAEGLRTPKGRAWIKHSILYMLRNPVYTGTYVWGAKGSAKFATEPMETLRIEDAHEALVSAEDFARVKAVIEQRRPEVTHPRTLTSDFLLTGLLFCATCGAPYTGHGAQSGQHHYYTCQTKMKRGAKACGTARNFEQGKVEAAVVDALREGALLPSVFGDVVREVQASLRSAQTAAAGERVVLQGQITEMDRRLDNLYEAVEAGTIPASRLAPRIEQVSGEKEALLARLAALPETEHDPVLEIGDACVEAWLADLRGVLERGSVDERRTLLRAWVKRVVAQGDELTIEYTFPLVPMDAPTGSGGSSGGATRRVVNRGRGRKPADGARKTTQGETAVRRFLPVVQNGSPSAIQQRIFPTLDHDRRV